jgi:hypothetical protein
MTCSDVCLPAALQPQLHRKPRAVVRSQAWCVSASPAAAGLRMLIGEILSQRDQQNPKARKVCAPFFNFDSIL